MNDSNQSFPGSIHKDNNSRKNLTLYHLNIRGISNKIDEFQISLYHNRPQVICLTEHHLKTEEITSINFFVDKNSRVEVSVYTFLSFFSAV
jgi:hypothetical protein